MPAYDYRCKTCDNNVTIVTSIKETIETPACAKCAELMVRQYSVGAVTFKGPGFYSND